MNILLAPLFVLGLSWQGADTPTLTSEQKLQLQNTAQRMTIAKLQFEAAQTELQMFVRSLEKQGWRLDLETLSYKKEPAPPAEKKDR